MAIQDGLASGRSTNVAPRCCPFFTGLEMSISTLFLFIVPSVLSECICDERSSTLHHD